MVIVDDHAQEVLRKSGEQVIPGNKADTILKTATSSGLIFGKPFDFLIITYVTSGNGTGEIETVTFKQGGSNGTVLGVLTLAYDANDKLSTVTRSAS